MKTISFTAESICAYQRGDKTQTRRVIRVENTENLEVRDGQIWHKTSTAGWVPWLPEMFSPYGQPGDLLSFLEGYQIISADTRTHRVQVRYLADDFICERELTPQEHAKWKARKFPNRATPGRFMYRSLIRYKPQVLSIRVERVKDITQEDAKAEGCEGAYTNKKGGPAPWWYDYREPFSRLWDSINAKRGYSWNSNPWVWVVEFERSDQ